MGLQKSIIEPSTVESQYHRITRSNGIAWNDDHTAFIDMSIMSYVSEEARKSGATPVSLPKAKQMLLNPMEAALIKKVLYTAISRDPDFQDAQNVIGAEDPDMTPLVDFLLDWEVQLLEYKIRKTMESGGIAQLTDAEYEAIVGTPEPEPLPDPPLPEEPLPDPPLPEEPLP